MKNNNKGFTLIELLVVIIIISILMAILLPAVTKAMCNARAGKASTLVRQIEAACEQYEKEQNIYPPGDGGTTVPQPAYLLLTAPGPRLLPYLQKNQDGRQFFVNNVDAVGIVKYRSNAVATVPNTSIQPVRNTNRVDIWCGNCDELALPIGAADSYWQTNERDGINNWR